MFAELLNFESGEVIKLNAEITPETAREIATDICLQYNDKQFFKSLDLLEDLLTGKRASYAGFELVKPKTDQVEPTTELPKTEKQPKQPKTPKPEKINVTEIAKLELPLLNAQLISLGFDSVIRPKDSKNDISLAVTFPELTLTVIRRKNGFSVYGAATKKCDHKLLDGIDCEIKVSYIKFPRYNCEADLLKMLTNLSEAFK